jgi:hypothetical protein
LTVHDKPFGQPHNEHNKHATSQAVNAACPLTVLVSATVAVTATNKGIITRPGPPKSVGIYDVHVKKTLVPFVYLADPSARVVDGKLIVYCSHDIEVAVAADDDGSQFGMTDYRILSFNDDLSKVTDHGSVLPIETVPWVKKQLWAPDAVCVDGKCYLYFPAKDKKGLFRIGVATSESPYGPFVAEKKPISSSYSIDPAVLVDDDGIVYLYFGGLWGGQLQNWMGNKYKRSARRTTCGPALKPRVGRLKANMKHSSFPLQQKCRLWMRKAMSLMPRIIGAVSSRARGCISVKGGITYPTVLVTRTLSPMPRRAAPRARGRTRV